MPETFKKTSKWLALIAATIASLTAIWQFELRPTLAYETNQLKAEISSMQCDKLFAEYLKLMETKSSYDRKGEAAPEWLVKLLVANNQNKQKYGCSYLTSND